MLASDPKLTRFSSIAATFRGLEGQYSFQLQFRIHREGDEDYIVRSQFGYLMRRSVSTEIDLEPGRYSVLIKVIATREEDTLTTPQEVVPRHEPAEAGQAAANWAQL